MGLFDDLVSPAAPQSKFSPVARDLAVRTMIGEAANEPDEGLAAVGHVILNRLNSGKYGRDIPNVVLARHQFEPWTTRAAELRGIPENSPAYQRAAALFDKAAAGELPDPTQGSTHFFSPTAQAALGRAPPKWAQGDPINVGRHSFYAPEGRVRTASAPAGLFADLLPAAPVAAVEAPPASTPSPPEAGGRFTDNPGQNFRVAREGDSPTVATPSEGLKSGFFKGVTFNFIDELKGTAEAGGLDPNDPDGARALVALLKGAYARIGGDPEADATYRAAVSRLRADEQRIAEQQPGAALAGELTGALVVPLGAAARAPGLAARTVQGAKTGAVVGGLAGLGEGTDATDRANRATTGAVVGSTIGAVAPTAVEGVIRTGQGLVRAASPVTTALRGIRDPEAEAGRRVVGALERDIRAGDAGIAPADLIASRNAGGPAAIMDMGGETTRALARSAANTSPEGRATLGKAINDRFESQSERLTGWLNKTFGPADAGATREAVKDAARAANQPAYNRSYAHPNAQAMWDEGFEQLSQAPVVQDAIRKATVTAANDAARAGYTPVRNPFVMDKATGRMVLREGATPNLQFWDHVKRNLDKVNTRESQDFSRVLRERLDDLVPLYGEARAGAAKFFGARDASEAGEKFLSSNMPIQDARRAFSKLSAPEQELFREGFIQSLVKTIESKGDRRNVLNLIAQSPHARQQIDLVMGPQRAREFEAMMRVEGIMDLARGAVQGNSTTARQLTELGLAGGAYGFSAFTGSGITDPSALTSAALVWGAAKGKGVIDQRVAKRVAEMLASNDPNVLRKGINIVARNQNMMNSLRAFDVRVARSGAEQAPTTGILPALQGPTAGRAEGDQPN